MKYNFFDVKMKIVKGNPFLKYFFSLIVEFSF